MDTINAIHGRRSVRSYEAQAVDRARIEALLSAAIRAPTAVHEELWAFVVVQDQALLKRLSDRAKPLFLAQARSFGRSSHAIDNFASPDFNIFYNAGTLIVIGTQASVPFAPADCWLAAENLMLAAYALRLGTCVIGSALGAVNLPDVMASARGC